MGSDGFYERYRYRDARDYVLVYGDHEYPSKGVYGVAYDMLHPDEAPIRERGLSGGLGRVVPELKAVGFDVRRRSNDDPPEAKRPRVWLVRGGETGGEEQVALDNDRVVIGWSELGDLTHFASLDSIARALTPDIAPMYESKGTRTRHAGELFSFTSRMQPGDYVVMPRLSKGGQVLAIGQVGGPYEYRQDFPVHARSTRAAQWLATDVPRDAFQPIETHLRYRGTVHELPDPALRLVEGAIGTPRGNAWIFQANPAYYDIDGAVRGLAEMNWTAHQYSSRIRAGDTAYLWRSGSEAGIVAIADVITDPTPMPDQEGAAFIRDPEKFAGEQTRVRLRIAEAVDPPLLRAELKEHPVLRDLGVLRFATPRTSK